MFAGTLGRGQFFVKSGLLATAEAAVLAVCIAIVAWIFKTGYRLRN